MTLTNTTASDAPSLGRAPALSILPTRGLGLSRNWQARTVQVFAGIVAATGWLTACGGEDTTSAGTMVLASSTPPPVGVAPMPGAAQPAAGTPQAASTDANGNPLPPSTVAPTDTAGATVPPPSGVPPTTSGVTDPAVPGVTTTTAPATAPAEPGVPAPGTAPTTTDPAVDPGAPPPQDAMGLSIGGICLAVCSSASADEDADGCGFENETDCVTLDAEIALGAAACTPTGEAPPAGDGFMMGCQCVRSCDSADSDADSEGVTDGWGWEYGATCVVAGSDTVADKATCVPPAMAQGDGYLLNNDDGSQKCVPACEHPEWVEDADGWGFEHQQSCIVEGSKAEGQVSRCVLTPRTDLPEPGNGFWVDVEQEDGSLVGECAPACVSTAVEDTDNGDGYGYEQSRTCIVPDSKAAVQSISCVPPAADVTGECPAVLTCPTVDSKQLKCGCTWTDGFAERKAEIMAEVTAQSGDRYFLASAMMETNTLKADYPDGDVYPDGRNKTGDAYNAGITKQNWGLMRQCHAPWNALGSGDYRTASALNTDLALDIQVYNECRAQFGAQWWSGHRNGASSLGQDTQDIRIFKGAMDWTYEMLQEGAGHFDDDVYFWVDVTAI